MFQVVDRPQRLVYTSTMTMPDGSSVYTGMEVTFEHEHGRTRMTIIHRGFPSAEHRDEFADGWPSILDRLGRVVSATSRGSGDTRTQGGTMSKSSDTRQPGSGPTPSPDTQRLDALVGRWRSQGHIVGDAPVPIVGTDIYEWLPGGYFLVHHVDVVVGEQTVQAIEIIGEYDPATDSFIARAYDNQGAVTIMRAKVDDQGVWTFTGGGDIAAAAQPSGADVSGAARSTLTVSADRSRMTAKWERSDDGSTWQPWMDMTFTRMS